MAHGIAFWPLHRSWPRWGCIQVIPATIESWCEATPTLSNTCMRPLRHFRLAPRTTTGGTKSTLSVSHIDTQTQEQWRQQHLDTAVTQSPKLDEVDSGSRLRPVVCSNLESHVVAHTRGYNDTYTGMVIGGDEGECRPIPKRFTAVTRNSYDMPLDNPVTMANVFGGRVVTAITNPSTLFPPACQASSRLSVLHIPHHEPALGTHPTASPHGIQGSLRLLDQTAAPSRRVLTTC